MVQGMAFLSKKGFNPTNQVNRKQVYEAQQHSKLEQERVRRREEQLRREREDEELCAARHNGDASQAQLRFMYEVPPGLKKEEQRSAQSLGTLSSVAAVKDLTQVQPGDDDAAVAFRRMLAATAKPAEECGSIAGNDNKEQTVGDAKLGFAPVLQGSTMERDLEKSADSRSALEKAVGRRDRGGALTLDEQISRFPQLKNAPMAKGMSATDVNVSFKPLGAQMRNVKCLACGIWGHSRGDRECQVTGWDPFSAASRPVSSSIRSLKVEESSARRTTRGDVGDSRRPPQSDDNSSNLSSSSGDNHRRGNLKHRSKPKKREKESQHRKRSRKHRSGSPSRRSKSRSHKTRQSRNDND